LPVPEIVPPIAVTKFELIMDEVRFDKLNASVRFVVAPFELTPAVRSKRSGKINGCAVPVNALTLYPARVNGELKTRPAVEGVPVCSTVLLETCADA